MKKSVLLTLFTALLFSSCNLTLDGTPRGSGAGNGSIPSEETNVKINFGREALLYEGEADPRYVILPNFSSLNSISDYGIEKIRVYVDSTTQDFNIAHGQTSIELRITQESHTIKLEGLDGSDKVVLKSDDWTGNITSGIVVPLGLKPFSQDASATDKGSVKLTINFPAKTSTITEYYVKCDVDGTGAEGDAGASGEHVELSSSVQGKTFTITDLDPGTHHVNITISKNSSFNGNATISFNAIVYAGLESSTVYDHSSQLTSAITYTHNDFKSVTIHDYALCVNGNGGKFPSNGISELPSGKLIGGKDRCIVFESIKEALDFTQDGDVGLSLDNEYTVYISGEIKASDTSDLQDGTNLVEIGLTGKTVNLTGYKETASDTPTLNANSKGRVLKVSAGTVKINDLTITGGDAGTANGGGILVDNGATVEILGQSSIQGCTAVNGGGICNCGSLTLDGTKIGGNTDASLNTASTKGGAVYNMGSLLLKGGTKVSAGVEKKNDICIYFSDAAAAEHPLIVDSSLTSDTVADITVEGWQRGLKILQSSDGTEIDDDIIAKFNLTNTGFNKVKQGDCVKFNAPIYIKPDGDDTGDGTELNPLATFTKVFTTSGSVLPYDLPAEIIIDGHLVLDTGKDTSVPPTAGKYPSSILIRGKTGNSSDSIERNLSAQAYNGFVMNINTSVPFTLKNIKITGGKNKNSSSVSGYKNFRGGGLCLTERVNVTLGEGCLIQGNTALENGGGIYMSNTSGESYLTILDGAEISGNNTTVNSGDTTGGGGIYCTSTCNIVMKGGTISSNVSQSYGGGIFNNGKVYMSGNAVIGNSGSTSSDYANSEDNCSNYAGDAGGGIYNKANVYLGKTIDSESLQVKDDTLNKGIYYNFASRGGGIYNEKYMNLTIISGNISKNGATSVGGGINNNSTALYITNGSDSNITFTKNVAKNTRGGAIFSSYLFQMGGNVIFGNSTGLKDNDIALSNNQCIKLTSPLNESTKANVTCVTYQGVSNGKKFIDDSSYTGGDFASDARKFSFVPPDSSSPKFYNIAEDGCLRMEPSSSITRTDFSNIPGGATWIELGDEEREITTVADFSSKPILRMFLKLESNYYVALKISFTGHGADFDYDSWAIPSSGSKVHKSSPDTIELDDDNPYYWIDLDGDDNEDIGIQPDGYIQSNGSDMYCYIFD
nr:hypothetical protein [uncultured Treponema sp.]